MTDLVKEDDVLPGCSTFDEFLQTAYPKMMEGVRTSNSVPAQPQYNYFQTYPSFEQTMKTEAARIQNVEQKLLRYSGVKKNIVHEPIQSKFDLITDLNDKLMDRILGNLAELDGSRFNPNEDYGEGGTRKVKESWNRTPGAAVRNSIIATQKINRENSDSVQLTTQTRIIRPQVFFKDKIDNRNVPWVPRIKEKPNQLKPLSTLLTVNDFGEEYYTNPYDYELTLWTPQKEWLAEIPESDLDSGVQPLSDSFSLVESEEELKSMIEELKTHKEIAVDLEHHSYRSFMGFTCLLQISTADKDYIVDALKLRHCLELLNEVFTNPKILKVFHGADNDIDWLQRDFSLYIVGMFDTYQAAKALNLKQLSLSHLLHSYCGVKANKSFQLYDWRIRPLPEKALKYAREDTHYLIYIRKKMTNELLLKGEGRSQLLEAVYFKGRDVCKKVYMKPLLTDESHMTLYRRAKRHFDNRQLYALKEIYKWRDTVAREEDESPGYVLSNHMMMQICQTLPRELQGILACCNPIPPLVRQNALELHNIILRAKDQPLVKSIVEETPTKGNDFGVSRDLDLELRLDCYTHDNTGLEFRDDLPTVLNGDLDLIDDPPDHSASLPIFAQNKTLERQMIQITRGLDTLKFVPPYERYLRVLPYSIQEENERLKKQKEEEDTKAERLGQSQFSDESTTAVKRVREEDEEPDEPCVFKPLSSQVNQASKKTKTTFNPELPTEPTDPILPIINVAKPDNTPPPEPIKPPPPVAHRPAKKHKPNNRTDFTPYDYSRVNYEKFGPAPNQYRGNFPRNRGNFRGKNQRGRNQGRKRGRGQNRRGGQCDW